MSRMRMIVLYGVFLVLFTATLGRVYLVADNKVYQKNADNQVVTSLELPRGRGNFYDRNGVPLTGREKEYYALCVPGESSYDRLYSAVSYAAQNQLYQKRNNAVPFLVKVSRDLSGVGIHTYRTEKRLLNRPIASHLLGYLDSSGHGVAGLELALDDTLWQNGGGDVVECVTTGTGALLEGKAPLLQKNQGEQSEVRLTLDAAIQQECEAQADLCIERGAIIVLDTATAEVLAAVSRPDYSPDNVALSIAANDTSLIDRTASQFTVGSVFKPVVAAAALRRGMDWFTWDCEGYVEVSGIVYRCAQGAAHGEINMQTALEKSCNCYFIELGLALGGDDILEAARDFGLGSVWQQAGGMASAKGNLPAPEALKEVGQLASFSFGQGQLLATPLQIAAVMNVIACGGEYRYPVFLQSRRTGDSEEQYPQAPVKRAITESQADYLRRMLVSVVENGLGRRAKPDQGGAGGKTGTAQTGRFDPDGQEYMNYWFAGFYPAQDPRYAIVVLQDGIVEPETSCAEIFAKICNSLYYGKAVDKAEK